MNLIQQTITPLPVHRHLAGNHYQGRPSRALRRRMRTAEKLTVSQHADKYRIVTSIDSKPGAWDSSEVPHTIKPMDTISLPHVREVYLCWPERAAKTQILINAMCWKVDQASKSGNIFWLMPTEGEAKKAMGERIIPVLKAKDRFGRPGRMSRYLSRYDDDTKRGTIRFTTGIRLFPAWSNGVTSMASYFGALNIGDEIDKFEEKTREGSDALTLIRKRGRDDRTRTKNLFASTPGRLRKIYTMATSDAQQVWVYHLRCPHCGELINPDEQHFDITPDTTVREIEHGEVHIACEKCGELIDEHDRLTAYTDGTWVCTKGAELSKPETVGFHMSAFVLPRVPLKEIAIAWVKAEAPDAKLSDKIAYANGYKVCDYDPPRATEDYKQVLAHCDDRPRDLVPSDTAALVLDVDTQMNGFYYEVAAVSYQNDEGSITSSLVNKGYLLTFSDLVNLSKRVWHDASGKEYRICSALIDSGGSRKAGMPAKHSRTKEVYEFCKQHPLFIPVKGRGRTTSPVSYTKLDKYPGTSKPIPGGLTLVVLDVHYYKDALASALNVTPGDTGSFNLYSGYTEQQLANPVPGIQPENELTDYAKHLCAEYRDELGNWQHDKKAGRNDWHDCATYRMFHIELLAQRGQLIKRLLIKNKQKDFESKTEQTRQDRDRPSWFRR